MIKMKLNVVELGCCNYKTALQIQETLLRMRQQGQVEDTLLLLEHLPVITLGKRGEYTNILLPKAELKEQGVEIYEINRGGDVTYHGPGQIVGYPVIDLSRQGRDVKGFVHKLEELFIRILKEKYQIQAHREEKKYTGVWVENSKITAIGIAVKRWVTMHGFAFNVNTQLEHFQWINPCGITDKGVTSLQKLTGEHQDFHQLNSLTADYFCEVFGYQPQRVELESLLAGQGITAIE